MDLKKILKQVYRQQISIADALQQIGEFPYRDLIDAKLDIHRLHRKGFPETIFAAGKSWPQLDQIIASHMQQKTPFLVSKLTDNQLKNIKKAYPKLYYYDTARMAANTPAPKTKYSGTILIITAGTSDIAIAQEAAITAQYMGNPVETVYDIGVAGLGRLIAHLKQIRSASVIIVVAGMEGALASVIGGLVDKPVIAVPTSVGYGASFKGLSALLGMLNSCSEGIVVVNIDGGFSAGYHAGLINRNLDKK